VHSHSHHFRRIGVCPKFRKLCMKNSGIAVFVKLQTSRSPTFRNSKLAITNRNVYRWLSCWYCSDWWSLLTYAFCFLSVTLLNGRVFSCTNNFAINALACTNVCAIGGYDRVYYWKTRGYSIYHISIASHEKKSAKYIKVKQMV